MDQLPNYISILFIIITAVSVIWFYLASESKIFLGVILLWIALQTYLSINGFYEDFEALPPRLFFALVPAVIFIIILFMTQKGKAFIETIDLKSITYLSIIRIPVEIVLALLFHNGLISIWQTFEGANFDIISGISAPIVAYMVFHKKAWNKKILLIWNIIGLILLLTIITISILAFPSPFQQIAFEQPNIGIAYFPFIFLPSVVVPIVLFTHFISIYRLFKKEINA